MNAQTHAGLLDESFVVAASLDRLAEGRQRFFGTTPRGPSWFHYRAAVVADLLADHLKGAAPVIRTPRHVEQGLLRSARVQMVQCVPQRTSRRTPTRAMVRNCPDVYAWPVLEVLRPGAIALLGADVRAGFERAYSVAWSDELPLLRVGTARPWGAKVAVFALRHPSSGFGMRSIESLRDFLSWR